MNTKPIYITDLPVEVIEQLSKLAKSEGKSRNQYLVEKLTELSDIGWQPQRYGEGVKCFTRNGGEVTLRNLVQSVQCGYENLTSQEADLIKRIKLLVDSKNGSRWDEAKEILTQSGFEVFNI